MNRRVYRWLLFLYPAAFRREYGERLVEAFDRDLDRRGTRLGTFWFFHLWDLIASAGREHGDAWRRRFGRLALVDPRAGLTGMTTHDLRYAVRGLRSKPGFAAVVILTLGLGIGLNTAIFSLVNGVLLKPLPYPDAERLVWGVGAFSGNNSAAVSPPDFLDYRAQSSSFDVLAARRGAGSYALTGLDAPRQISGQEVSAGFFEALGARPVLGRTFTREEESAAGHRVVVLSHGFWSRQFGEDPAVRGRTITLDSEPYEVVGVMPAGFQLFSPVDFWTPIPFDEGGNLIRRFHNVRVVGRLAPGVSLEAAQADVDVIGARLEATYPASNETWRLRLIPLQQTAVGFLRPAFLILSGAVGLVLLIACGNVANLTLSRGATRAVELAVRQALGASRTRVIRQLLTENVLLAMTGGAFGIALAYGGIGLLRALEPGNLPRLESVSIDGEVLLFALLVSLGTGIVFGLVPAFTSSRVDVQAALKAGGRSQTASGGRLRGALVMAEVALSLILLVGASLLIQSFWRLSRVEPGFQPENLVSATIALPRARYADDERRVAFADRLTERLEGMPGIAGVAVTDILPLSGRGNDTYLAVPGRHQLGTETQFNAQIRSATPNYFDVMGMSLLRGRGFTDADDENSPAVIIINQPFADQIFPEEDPIGQRVQIDLGRVFEAEIVGVVSGVNAFGLGSARPLTFYSPFAQRPSGYQEFALRTTIDPEAVAALVAPAVEEIDPLQPVAGTAVYEELIGRSVAQPRFQMQLLTIFASIAIALAAIGIYGVLSYYVSQRAREVGLRVALGATSTDVYRLVVGRGMMLTGIGLVVGVGGSLLLTRFMSSLLFGVSATDPLTFALVSGILVATAFVASYLPARRATRVDPVTALRDGW